MSISITDISQLALGDDALVREYSIAIISPSLDSRSSFISSKLNESFRRVIGIDESPAFNDGAMSLSKKGFVDICSVSIACEELLAHSRSAHDTGFRLFIDVSSLSRRSMGAIFACVKMIAQDVSIDLTIGYSLARYVSPPDGRFPIIRRLGPVNRTFAGWGAPASWPVDVVVSLGYEEGKALGAVEYLEPRKRWVFVPNSPEERFLRDVTNHNKQLLRSGDSVFDYDLIQPAETYFKLISLLTGITVNARAVLLPFGPKLFFAISLVVASSMNKVAVWHVDGDDEPILADLQAAGSAVFLNCKLSIRSASTTDSDVRYWD